MRVATRIFKGAGAESLVRRARVTVVDAGSQVQAFNAVVYPSPVLELPVLGVDLIRLPGGLLVGMDFSPLSREPEYLREYCETTLGPILAKYQQVEGLITKPSTRFYGEEPEFFSPAMFFSRAPMSELAPGGPLISAFQEICDAYSAMLKGHDRAKPAVALSRPGEVRWQHTRYDAWHKPRDPAVRMFTRFFGQEWTEAFVDEVLFPWANALKRRSGPLLGRPSILACMRKESLKLHTRSQAPADGKTPEKKRVPMSQRTVTKASMLQYLVDSMVVYESFEAAVAASEDCAQLRDTGLERVEVLREDIGDMSSREGLVVPAPSDTAAEYAAFVGELASQDTPRFLCHWYNHHLAHTAGGMMIYSMARKKAFGEDGGPDLGFWTRYPKAGASNDYRELLNDVRLRIEACAGGWESGERAACTRETPAAFERSGGLLGSLWAEA